jgi:phage protein D
MARYVSHAPVFRVDGDLQRELGRDVLHLEVEETTAGLRTCTVRLQNEGPRPNRRQDAFLYLDGSVVDLGKTLEVSIGPKDRQRTVFKGLVSGIEGEFHEGLPSEVVVFAEDALMKLRMTRRSRTYEQKTDAQIAREVAQANGLACDCDAPGPTYAVVQQWNQSDLAFLRDRARRIQAELWVEDDTLKFKARGSRGATHLTLVQGNHLIHSVIRADLAHQRTRVRVSGYDATARQAIDEEASGDAIQVEAPSGRTGPEVLGNAFGDRADSRVRDAPLTDEEARRWATAEMLRRARGFVRVSGEAEGQPDMTVGSTLELRRVSGGFSGDGWYVTRVCHVYDHHQAHRTHFEAERPFLGTSPT